MNAVPPVTQITEEEKMFKNLVSEFAEERIRPHVMEMDQKAEFRRDILSRFFELGLMGIEIPERM